MTKPLTDLEMEVLRAFCLKNDLSTADLASQLEQLSVHQREFTGVGVYVYFESYSPHTNDQHEIITGESAGGTGEAVEVGFNLYLGNGVIHMLEGFSYLGEWPTDTSNFELVHA